MLYKVAQVKQDCASTIVGTIGPGFLQTANNNFQHGTCKLTNNVMPSF